VLPARAHDDRAGCNDRAKRGLAAAGPLAPTDAPRKMADERGEAADAALTAGETGGLTAGERRALTGNRLPASGDPQATMAGRRAPTANEQPAPNVLRAPTASEQPPAPDLPTVTADRADVQPEGVVRTAIAQLTVDADPTAPPANPPHSDADRLAAVPVRPPPGGAGLIAVTTRRPAKGLADRPGGEDPGRRSDSNAVAQTPHPAVARTPPSLPGRHPPGGAALRVAALE
jgi:hypothetical protein